jgi:phosphohistidine swiveling domain-containing protein
MNSSMTAVEAPMKQSRTAPHPPAPFTKPSPGSWTLDAAHCERPLPRFTYGLMEASFARGFREGLTAYGALLETIEAALVNGFYYTCVRPLGAPPEPKGMPPKAVFKALMALHPEMRRRVKRSDESMRGKLWREEIRQYEEEWTPAHLAEGRRLLEAPIHTLNDATLADHLAKVYEYMREGFYLHHRMNCSRVIPVGDFIAHVQDWTAASTLEILEALRGASPGSRIGLDELETLVALVRADDALRSRIERAGDAEEIITELETRDDAVGNATRAWLAVIGHHVTGFSPGYPTLRETPATLVESIKGSLTGTRADNAAEAGSRALARLRERVPAEHRATFDDLYEEARLVYHLRDTLCMKSIGMIGIGRRALLEAGRRLASRGLVHEPEAALEATVAELRSLLVDGTGPSLDTLQKHLEWRRTATTKDAPELLGPPPGSPPPIEWLPRGAVRLQRAVSTYIQAMSGEASENTAAASGGRRRGIARLVLEPGDFDRISPGDVLVARITTPTYNILLPMLAGIVTDRGGVLSHPAIVSREYGIPGVVGTRNATTMIPDGALVEIDGDAGTVTVLS